MLLVFFLLLTILQRSLPSQGESHQTLKSVFSNWRHLVSTPRNSLVAIFRLFLILGRRNLRRFSFWDHQMIFYGIIQDLVLTLMLCFLHACISALDLMQCPWRVGFLAVFILRFSFTPEKLEFYFSTWFWQLDPCHLLRNCSAFHLLIIIWISWWLKYMFYAHIQS